MSQPQKIKQEQTQEDQEKFNQNNPQAEKQALDTLVLGQSPTEQFNSILMKQFQQMDGKTQEKIKKLYNRLQKFFLREKGAKINIKDGYFCRKRQPFYTLKGVHVLDNQIILYGIDFAKKRDLVKIYQPEDIQPIDMSHVKLIYSDFYSAMQALRKNQRQQVIQNGIKLEKNMKQPPKCWMEMRPYYISNYQRRILARFATSEQFEIRNTRKLESNIPLFAKKVYDLKKKESYDMIENCKLREELLTKKKLQKREQRSNYDHRENYNRDNHDFDVQKSQKSYTLNIGKGRGKNNQSQQEKSFSYRQRSRDKDFDKESVCSKKSSLSSLAGNFENKMKFDDQKSVVSDASFILQHNEENDQLLKDMAMRLGLMDMNQHRQNEAIDQSFQLPAQQNSFVSSSSSTSYRLSQNMPDARDRMNESSTSNNHWKSYRQYVEEQERQEERLAELKRQQREVVIVLDDE